MREEDRDESKPFNSQKQSDTDVRSRARRGWLMIETSQLHCHECYELLMILWTGSVTRTIEKSKIAADGIDSIATRTKTPIK